MHRKLLIHISRYLLTHSHDLGSSPHKHWVVWLTTKPKVAGSTPAFRANNHVGFRVLVGRCDTRMGVTFGVNVDRLDPFLESFVHSLSSL